MKYFKPIIILALIVYPIYNQAQSEIKFTEKAKVRWGTPFKSKGFILDEIIGNNGKETFITSSRRKGKLIVNYEYGISIIDSNMNIKKSASFVVDKKEYINDVRYLDNKIILFSSAFDRKNMTTYFYYTEYDENLMKKSKKTLFKVQVNKKRFQPSLGIEVSENESKILLYVDLPYEKDAAQRLSLKVFDSKMRPIWEQNKIELPYKDKLFELLNYTISNKGDVYTLGKRYKDDKKKWKIDAEPPIHHIISYSNKGTKVKDFELELTNKYINEISFIVDQNENLITFGLYGTENNSGIKGVFYMSIDGESKKIIKSSFKEFTEDFITQGWSEREVKKAKKKEEKKGKEPQMYKYDLRHVIVDENGGITILAEQYYVYVVSHTSTDSNGNTHTTYTYHYHYNDIIAIRINKNGEIEWTTKIEKSQHSINDGGRLSSFAVKVKNDKIYLIYNENSRDFFEDEDKKTKKKNKRTYFTLLVTLDSKGEYLKEILLNNKEEDSYTVPKLCDDINEKEFLIYNMSRKEQKFGSMTIK